MKRLDPLARQRANEIELARQGGWQGWLNNDSILEAANGRWRLPGQPVI